MKNIYLITLVLLASSCSISTPINSASSSCFNKIALIDSESFKDDLSRAYLIKYLDLTLVKKKLCKSTLSISFSESGFLQNNTWNIVLIFYDNDKNQKSFVSEIRKIEFVKKINEDGSKLTLFASNGTEVIPKIFQISSELGIKIKSISLTQPTLDDVFISYTGHEIKGDESGFNRKREHAKMKRLRA